jgi:predicted membrane protein DUF2232
VLAPLAALLAAQRPSRRELVYAAVLTAIVIWLLVGTSDAFEELERAWVVLLTGSLVVVLVSGRTRGFVTTTLAAVTGAGAAAAVLMAATRLTGAKLVGLAQQHYFLQSRLVLEVLAPVGSPARELVQESAQTAIRFVGAFLPGLVLLQTVAAVALAWALYHRIAREPASEPLAPLAAFRFNDHLIWGVALSLLVVVLPRFGWARALGGNLLLFFGGLYVMRGVAVLAAVAAAAGFGGPLAYLMVLVVTVVLLPVVAVAVLALGLTDTLVDWRLRLARAAPRQ